MKFTTLPDSIIHHQTDRQHIKNRDYGKRTQIMVTKK